MADAQYTFLSFVRSGFAGDTERCDAPVADADIRRLGPPGQNACAMADQQIEMG